MSFDSLNLNTPLRNALADLEYVEATPIQRESYSVIMSGRDVVGIAQTGTGKTFAYLLPLIRQLKYSKENLPRILVLVPTRELVLQVEEEVRKLTKYMTVRVAGVYGGTNINTQKLKVLAGIDILVGTPGRTRDLALNGALKTKNIKKIVIDEVDEMLNLGFLPQLLRIFDLLPKKRQHLLFSATMTKAVAELIEDFFNAPVTIEIAPTGTPLELIQQSAYEVPNFLTKVNLLQKLLETQEDMSKVLVFVSTKKKADLLFERLSPNFENQLGIIHSNKSQNFRINSVQTFEEGTTRVLIATDLISRGLDFTDITHVINFDLSEVPVHYMHRIGRTGRADRPGAAISFISENEKPYQLMIEAMMRIEIPMEVIPADVEFVSTMLEFEKERDGGDKHYLPNSGTKSSGGAYHEKKLKNTKVNRAHEKRTARKLQKRSARRKKRK